MKCEWNYFSFYFLHQTFDDVVGTSRKLMLLSKLFQFQLLEASITIRKAARYYLSTFSINFRLFETFFSTKFWFNKIIFMYPGLNLELYFCYLFSVIPIIGFFCYERGFFNVTHSPIESSSAFMSKPITYFASTSFIRFGSPSIWSTERKTKARE